MIDGHTRTCGLLGNPVEHTLSPVIHNYLAQQMGVNLVYVPFCVPQEHLQEAVQGAHALQLFGLNVTVPFKSKIIPFLKELDPLAEQIGAVNTLVPTKDGYKGYNTDMPGLYRAMTQDGVKIEGEQVIILGAGGVARAVAVLMVQKGASRVVILNRTLSKAQLIAEEVNGFQNQIKVEALELHQYEMLANQGKYLVIQATNIGMVPNENEAVIEEDSFYHMVHTGYDLIFNPACTRFLHKTQEHGGKAFNGMGMLLYQGIIAYELWTGTKVTNDLAAGAFHRMQQALGQR